MTASVADQLVGARLSSFEKYNLETKQPWRATTLSDYIYKYTLASFRGCFQGEALQQLGLEKSTLVREMLLKTSLLQLVATDATLNNFKPDLRDEILRKLNLLNLPSKFANEKRSVEFYSSTLGESGEVIFEAFTTVTNAFAALRLTAASIPDSNAVSPWQKDVISTSHNHFNQAFNSALRLLDQLEVSELDKPEAKELSNLLKTVSETFFDLPINDPANKQ